MQHIEKLYLHGRISHLNLDYLVNLKLLSLEGDLDAGFNFEIFKNLCNQLEVIKIGLNEIDEKTLVKMFDSHNFSNLKWLYVKGCNIKRLKREFTNYFPNLTRLCIMRCNIETVEPDSFSKLKQLDTLYLMGNPLEFIEKDTFANLKNLQTVSLKYSKLKNLDPQFIGLSNCVKIEL